MKKMITAIGACALAISTAASADALALMNQDDADDTPALPEASVASSWYFAAAVGGNIALDAEGKESGSTFKFKTGIGLNLGVGYAFAKNLAVEVRTGILWNKLKEVEGGNGGTLSGGDGQMYQVPVMASVVYSIPLNEKTNLGIKAGAGMQWTDFNVDSITVSAGGGSIDGYAFKHKSAAFRWEVGLQLATEVATNVRIGGGVIFSGTSEVNIGSMTGPGPSSPDEKLKGLYNISLGFGVNIAF